RKPHNPRDETRARQAGQRFRRDPREAGRHRDRRRHQDRDSRRRRPEGQPGGRQARRDRPREGRWRRDLARLHGRSLREAGAGSRIRRPPLGESIETDPKWDIGVEDVATTAQYGAYGEYAGGLDPNVAVTYDRV